jgi:hypothetical protein
MNTILLTVAIETAKVTLLVLVMMVIVDLVNVWTRGRIAGVLKRGSYATTILVQFDNTFVCNDGPGRPNR